MCFQWIEKSDKTVWLIEWHVNIISSGGTHLAGVMFALMLWDQELVMGWFTASQIFILLAVFINLYSAKTGM